MATVLKNVLNFTGLVVGVPSVQAHLINVNGLAKVPRILLADQDGFTITADSTNVTVTRNNGALAAVNIYCELWHSIEDSEPLPNGIATSNYPVVIQGGGTSAPTAVVGNLSAWEFASPMTSGGGAASNLTVMRQFITGNLSATRADMMFDLPAVTGGSQSVTMGIGFYTMSGSTASLATGLSTTFTYGVANQSDFSNPRWRSLAGAVNLTAGDYLIGAYHHVSTTFSETVYGSIRFMPGQSPTAGGFGPGILTSGAAFTTSPGSIHLSAILQTAIGGATASGNNLLIPAIHVAGTF